MNYSTLKEAYNEDTFDKDKKMKKKKVKYEEFTEENEVPSTFNIQDSNKQKDNPVANIVSVKNSNIQPFLDEDLNRYLNVNEFTSNPEPIPVENIKEPKLVMEKTPIISKTTVQQEANKQKREIFYRNLINIGLFIFIGVLIIFLCDQITEIAVNIGMKRTIAILEPYLQKELPKDI